MKKCVLCVCVFMLTVSLGPGFSKKSYSYQHFRQNFHYPFHVDFDNDEDPASQLLCLVMGICSFRDGYAEKPGLATIHEWSKLEYDYASDLDRESDISSQAFIPGRPAPIDVDVYYGPHNVNKVFVSMPRFRDGIPATLGSVSQNTVDGNPIIKPYPSWRWHKNPSRCNHDRIVSVYRMKIDECGRLWILDTGRLGEKRVCQPQVLAFDLQTNELLHRYAIPSSQIEDRSILVTPIVDVRDNKCRDTFVYLADCQTFSIIVYDVKRDTSWQVNDKTLWPYPTHGTFTILGESFELMDGVLGMDLEPYTPGKDRKLFVHAMSSPTENWVYTSDLRNQSRFTEDPNSSPEIFHVYDGHRSSQSAAEAIDSRGIAYFGLMSDTSINCWNTETEYGPDNIDVIEYNPTTLQFPSGVKIIKNRSGADELWVLTSRFQKIAAGTLSTDETNFRILGAKTNDILHGTKCKGSRPSITDSYKPVSQRPSSGYQYGRRGQKRQIDDSVHFHEHY